MRVTSLNEDKINIVLLEGIHKNAINKFHQANYENINYIEKSLSTEQLKQVIYKAHFIGIRSRTQLTAEILQHAKHLNAIGCFCIGTNQVDLNAAEELGIPVFNAPFANTRSVAELVLAECILLNRKIISKNTQMHVGKWDKSAKDSYEIRGKTLGIIGYGYIGTQLSVLAESLGINVLFYVIENKLSLGNAKKCVHIDDLLKSSDFISIHVPETPQTINMVDDKFLSQMKEKSILINASRGSVIVIEDLYKHLTSGKLRGAAIDVFPKEPKSNKEEFKSPLQKLDNVILTPHIGGSTQEAQVNIGNEVAEKIIKYSDNGSTLSAVNFPNVSLPTHINGNRILHIHNNHSGILQKINQVFAKGKVNIISQYLKTSEKIGYVVIDIDTNPSHLLIESLKEIPETIKTRVLY